MTVLKIGDIKWSSTFLHKAFGGEVSRFAPISASVFSRAVFTGTANINGAPVVCDELVVCGIGGATKRDIGKAKLKIFERMTVTCKERRPSGEA